MKRPISFFGLLFCIYFLGVAGNPCRAQNNSTTYTVDPSFSTSDLFRGNRGVFSIIPYVDGRILVAGDFWGGYTPFYAIGMVWGDGSQYTQWNSAGGLMNVSDMIVQDDGIVIATISGFGKLTPDGDPWLYEYGEYWGSEDFSYGGAYPIESVWCLYEQEDGRILMGGAIATDSLQPTLYRSLIRLMPDGELDTSFPPIEIEPNDWHSRIAKIYRTDAGQWIVSGNFYAINSHETAFVARLNSDFSVDTSFVSPLKYVFSVPEPLVVFMDSQERMWVSGHFVVTQENPQDTINMIRILPSGAVDPSFVPKEVKQIYPPGSINVGSHVAMLVGGLELMDTDHFLLYGRFNYWNDTLQPCITVVNDAGYIQANYFLGNGATEQEIDLGIYRTPLIGEVVELPNGSLLIGGEFTKFMGHKHYNMLKLNRSTINTLDHNLKSLFTVFPNPADHWVKIGLQNVPSAEIKVFDNIGRVVYQGRTHERLTRISTTDFAPGVYLINVKSDVGEATKKLLINQQHSSPR